MITLEKMGQYKIVETKHNTKIIDIDGKTYAWVEPQNIGEILVSTYKMHKTDCILSVGHYKLYKVENEPELSDQQHLELEAGRRVWQGYLLPTGLPNENKKKSRIIPTSEIITMNAKYCDENGLRVDIDGADRHKGNGKAEI